MYSNKLQLLIQSLSLNCDRISDLEFMPDDNRNMLSDMMKDLAKSNIQQLQDILGNQIISEIFR